jgi:hypothetical protein
VPGTPDIRNARYVLRLLDLAIDGALTEEFDALVTAPVHKGLINDAGIAFTEHTNIWRRAPAAACRDAADHGRAARGAWPPRTCHQGGERRAQRRVTVATATTLAAACSASGTSPPRASRCAA